MVLLDSCSSGEDSGKFFAYDLGHVAASSLNGRSMHVLCSSPTSNQWSCGVGKLPFPSGIRYIKWPETCLSAKVTKGNRTKSRLRAEVTISSKLYGRLIRLQTRGVQAMFSDNFFDIPPGEERSVWLRVKEQKDTPVVVVVSAANSPEGIEIEL